MRTTVLSALACLTVAWLPQSGARAQEPTSVEFVWDRVEVDTSAVPGATCYLSDRYIVVERRERARVGADFFIRPRQRGRCEADSLSGDYVLRDEWAAYFAGLHGDVLFIDSGTGPDLRWLILVDVANRHRLAELSYVELVPGPDSLTLGVWDGYELGEPLAGCEAPVGGLLPGVDSLFYLDVRDGRKRFSGRTRCARRQ